MRAPSYATGLIPVEPYKARFSAPAGPTLAGIAGRVMVASGNELGRLAAPQLAQDVPAQTVIEAVTNDTAGRARALQDRAALADVVALHTGMQGSTAIAGQASALDALERIRQDGQSALGVHGMIEAYDRQMAPAMADAVGRISDHTLRQTVVERANVADMELKGAQHSAAQDWRDPPRFVRSLADLGTMASSQLGPDASDTDRAQAVRGAIGGAIAKAVDHALSAHEPEFAAHIVNGWGETLTPAAYQTAVARLSQASQDRHMASIFAEAAGGNIPQGAASGASMPLPPPDAIAVAAPVGAAVHPLAGGTVTALDGPPDNASIRISHPDGSSATYGGLGLTAVRPGDIVTPAQAIGSARPTVMLATAAPDGKPADAGAWVQQAGGSGALIGDAGTARVWDMPAMLERIAGRADIPPEDKTLASNFALRRMAVDHARLIADDIASGRSVATLVAGAPDRFAQIADLPGNVTASMSPAMLAQVDTALRNAAAAPAQPAVDSPAALRLALMQRQDPSAFTGINLAPFIGAVHPADLGTIAESQSRLASGQEPVRSGDHREAVLDGMARYELTSGAPLHDDLLKQIRDQAEARLRVDRIDPTDRSAIDNGVTNAIQTGLNPP
jgi:hypothetical protein